MVKVWRVLCVTVAVLLTFVVYTAYADNNVIRVFLDGEEIVFDVPPVEVQGRTLVPMRAIFNALEMDVDWQHDVQTAYAIKNGIHIVIIRDSNQAYVNYQSVKLDVPARTVGSRMMVPLRFISESLGVQVQWMKKERRVDLFTSVNSNDEKPEPEIPTIIGDNQLHAEGRVAFGLNPPRSVAFDQESVFLEHVPTVYYNMVLEFQWKAGSTSNGQYPLHIRTELWNPDGEIIMDRVDTNSEVSFGLSGLRSYGALEKNEIISDENHSGEDSAWEKGEYRLLIYVNGEKTIEDGFLVVSTHNDMGNTSSNLYNKGLAVERGDAIYFAGKNGGLFKQSIRNQDIERLSNDRVSYLNASGQWVYYVNLSKDNVISRIRFDGRPQSTDTVYSYYYYWMEEASETIVHDAADQMLLVDDWLYYVNISDHRHLYRVRTDGSEKEKLLAEPIMHFYLSDGQIVFMTFEQSLEDKANNRTSNRSRIPMGIGQTIGYLYSIDLEYARGINQASGEDAVRISDQEILGMVVERGHVYYLVFDDVVSWKQRVSGRIPGSLYKIRLTSGAQQSEQIEEHIADEVMNFFVDEESVIVQTGLNRGKDWIFYTQDGEIERNVTTQVIRKRYVNEDHVMLHNRNTFPVTYMNRAHDSIFYYVGDNSDMIVDSIHSGNDHYLSKNTRTTHTIDWPE